MTVLIPGQKPHTAHVPVVVRGNEKGEQEGVASVELDEKKEKFIFEAKLSSDSDAHISVWTNGWPTTQLLIPKMPRWVVLLDATV